MVSIHLEHQTLQGFIERVHGKGPHKGTLARNSWLGIIGKRLQLSKHCGNQRDLEAALFSDAEC